MNELDPISTWAQTVNWQAWEAVGTISAAVVALALALMANSRAAAEKHEHDLATVKVLLSITAGMRTIYFGSLNRLRGENKTALSEATLLSSSEPFQTALVALDRMDLTRLPTGDSIGWFMMIRSEIHTTRQYARMVVEGAAGGANLDSSLNNGISVFNACIDAMHAYLDQNRRLSPLRRWRGRTSAAAH